MNTKEKKKIKKEIEYLSIIKDELKDNISKIKALLFTIKNTKFIHTIDIDEAILVTYLNKRLTPLYHEQKLNKQMLESFICQLDDMGELNINKLYAKEIPTE